MKFVRCSLWQANNIHLHSDKTRKYCLWVFTCNSLFSLHAHPSALIPIIRSVKCIRIWCEMGPNKNENPISLSRVLDEQLNTIPANGESVACKHKITLFKLWILLFYLGERFCTGYAPVHRLKMFINHEYRRSSIFPMYYQQEWVAGAESGVHR